jgi:hypothetical protein
MANSAFIPVGDLPKTEWAGRAPCHWLWDFEKELFEKAGGHPLFGEKDVEYRFNSHGYRCPEFSETTELRVIAIGCSYVFGYALPAHLIFPEIIRARIESKTGKRTVLWNLSLGGASNDYIARVLHLGVPLLKPDLVIVNFTFLARREHFGFDGGYYGYLPGVDPTWNEEYRESYKHLSGLANKNGDRANFYRNYKSCEALLSTTPWFFSTVARAAVQKLEEHLNLSHFIGYVCDQEHPIDLARDQSHPGPQEHLRIADRYWEQIQGVDFGTKNVR